MGELVEQQSLVLPLREARGQSADEERDRRPRARVLGGPPLDALDARVRVAHSASTQRHRVRAKISERVVYAARVHRVHVCGGSRGSRGAGCVRHRGRCRHVLPQFRTAHRVNTRPLAAQGAVRGAAFRYSIRYRLQF